MKKKLISFLIALVALMPVASIASSPQKLATLINNEGTKKITVVGSNDAQWYFTLGYHLMTNVLGGTGTIYQAPSLFETSLASSMLNSATSATLASGKTRDGFSLSGNYCFTIDSGLNTAEYVCGVASGTALTSLQRGIGADGVSTISVLQFAHRYGADVKVTDFPVLQQFGRILNGTDTIPNVLSYGSGVATSTFTNPQMVASKGYVDSVSYSGSPNGSTIVKGIWQGATPTQQASASSTGSTGANLALQSAYASSTTLGTSTANYAVITNSNGYIDPSFLAGTSTNYTFNGLTSGFSFPYGLGSDGNVTIATNTSLTRDMYYSNLTVNNGITLNSNGFKIFVQNTLNTIGTGKIASDGPNGNQGGAGAPSNPGGYGATTTPAYSTGTLPIPATGASGGNGSAGNQNNPQTGSAGTSVSHSLMATSSVGAAGSAAAGGTLGGAAGTVTSAASSYPYSLFNYSNLYEVINGTLSMYSAMPGSGGGGGGSGASNGQGYILNSGGGSGGSNGGFIWIAARIIINLNVEAIGGAGGPKGTNGSSANDGGAGGSGSGGFILIFYQQKTTITSNVSSGSPAPGGNTGNPGLEKEIQL